MGLPIDCRFPGRNDGCAVRHAVVAREKLLVKFNPPA